MTDGITAGGLSGRQAAVRRAIPCQTAVAPIYFYLQESAAGDGRPDKLQGLAFNGGKKHG